MKKRRLFLTVCFALICLFLSPVQAVSGQDQSGLSQGKTAKYVFLIIGDGMGVSQRALAEAFLASQDNKNWDRRFLLMSKFPAHGLVSTHAYNRFITDSAAAGTALASGYKTNVGYIGVDHQLKPLESIAEKAKARGMKVGIISSVSLDHATPASFYAHRHNRGMYYEISLDLVNSGFDFFGGGGLLDPLGKKLIHSRGNVFKAAVKNGYRIVENKEQFMALSKNHGKVIAVNRRRQLREAIPYNIDRRESDISLAEFIRKGIELLENPNGFFMMAEGGKIDWAGHANDAATLVREVLALDEALKEAYDFYQKHPDETLIVVAADHETGGLGLGFAGTKYESFFEVLKNQKVSFEVFSKLLASYRDSHPVNLKFEDLSPLFKKYFGLCLKCEGIMAIKEHELSALKDAFETSAAEKKFKPGSMGYLLYGDGRLDPITVALTRVISQKAGVSWTTYSHTGAPIIASALGVGAESFNGHYDNADIPKKIMAAMKIK